MVPGKESTTDYVDVGYIDENGQFVVLIENHLPSSVYWSPYGVKEEFWPFLSPFYVLRTKNNGNMTTTSKNNSSNANYNNQYSGYVLEMKINSTNNAYFGASGDYPPTYPSLEFITFYNTTFPSNLALNFYSMSALKTVVFKG
jgi:hypothetical protein